MIAAAIKQQLDGSTQNHLDSVLAKELDRLQQRVGGMRDARAGCPSQDDDADEQCDASVGSKYSSHDCHRVYHPYQDDWSDFENEIRSGRRLTMMPRPELTPIPYRG